MLHFECFSVKILDNYNITVHSFVCNKLSDSECVSDIADFHSKRATTQFVHFVKYY